jgi:hypothetical protein
MRKVKQHFSKTLNTISKELKSNSVSNENKKFVQLLAQLLHQIEQDLN